MESLVALPRLHLGNMSRDRPHFSPARSLHDWQRAGEYKTGIDGHCFFPNTAGTGEEHGGTNIRYFVPWDPATQNESAGVY